jgi:integrase
VALDLVFCRPDGQPEDPNVIGRRFTRRVADVEGLPQLSLHGLRHTHATLLLADGIDAKTVSERLERILEEPRGYWRTRH